MLLESLDYVFQVFEMIFLILNEILFLHICGRIVQLFDGLLPLAPLLDLRLIDIIMKFKRFS